MMTRTFCAAALLLLAGAGRLSAATHPLPENGKVFSAPAFGKHGHMTPIQLMRTLWDFDRAMDLSHGERVSFEFRCDNPEAVGQYTCYLRTGPADKPTGWYVFNFASLHDGWNRVAFSKGRNGGMSALRRSGTPEGWDKITGLRLSLWGDGEQTTNFEMRDFRILKPDEPVPLVERRLMWTRPEGVNGDWDWPRTAKFLADCRLSDAIVLTTEKGRLSYRSAHSPSDEKLLAAHGDQLAQGLEACHRAGLRFHAWMICWQVRGTRAYIDEMRKANRLQYPEPSGQEGWVWPWLCPSDPRNVALEADLACELAARGVDGVHLDYIRYNENERGCYCARCRALIEKRLGRAVANWPRDVKRGGCDAAAWDEFRRETITRAVRTIRARLKAEYPKVELSAAVMPEPLMLHRAQDWPGWCREKLVDFICPMDYRFSPQSLKLDLKRQKPVCESSGVPIYPGIGITPGGFQLNAWQAGRQIDLVRAMGFPGYTFFWLLKGNAHVYRQLADGGPLAE